MRGIAYLILTRSDSTTAAIRYERKTGLPIGGTFHSEKGEDYLNSMTNWLRRSPTAHANDRRIAQQVMLDLMDAFER